MTAVISGDRTLEARVFSTQAISVGAEKKLTAQICRLMNQWQLQWKG